MSGFSTIIFFERELDEIKILEVLDLLKIEYYSSDDEKNCYEIWVKKGLNNISKVYEIEECGTISFYKFEEQNISYPESFFNEVKENLKSYTLSIDIFFMRSNNDTINYVLEILNLFRNYSRFCFLNQKLNTKNIDKYILTEISTMKDTFLISSDAIPIMLKMEKFLELGID